MPEKPRLIYDPNGQQATPDANKWTHPRADVKSAAVVTLEDGTTRGQTLSIDPSGSLQSDSPQYIVRQDDTTTAGKTYFGYALPGTATSASAWRIIQVDESSGTDVPLKLYADGDTLFDNIWNNRALLSYS